MSYKCDDNRSVKIKWPIKDQVNKGRPPIETIPIRCGKCLNCKRVRVAQWSFRLMQESKVSISAKFITLTYNTEHIPITENRFMTLRKEDLQAFFKRLRYYEKELKQISQDELKIVKRGGDISRVKKLKYYAVGEYGTKRKRPHYHIILFNLKDEQSIYKSWTFGSIDIGEVNNNTIDYTLKYMQKESNRHKFKAFDGEKEFSLMSQGLGQNWRNKEIDSFYQKNLDINYVMSDKGYKIPMPKTYRDKILSKEQKDKQVIIIKDAVEKENARISEKSRILGVKQRSIVLKRGQDRPID